ncbi:hypothetical protein C7974DRAFT_94288 [Boeremia exigua]|uniref:uncharacterized protein n=1 Tax=Boeremia exigua TaxID=749465 RepID=UPI001E8DE7FE|nr:uncharacterized protein C7974DRAFT_94288 [Boeremia exigua]KAH6642038.1 hypothetical protein C7974DRAFT_94288 [Boeremia exigua]
MSPKHIVSDTLLARSLQRRDRLTARLRPQALRCLHRLKGYAWLENAEREYTYIPLLGQYVPFAQVFQAIIFRDLHFAGVPEPRSVASEKYVEYFIQGYRSCTVRSGAKECIVGDRERVQRYF